MPPPAQARDSLALDSVLEEVGQFGPYQARLSCFILLPILFSAIYNAQYVFTAADVNYRCVVPECEPSPQWPAGDWAQWALVAGSSCERRVPLSSTCNEDSFGKNTQRCTAWVYEHSNSIVAEFDLACQEWKRTLVGTVHSLGVFTALIYIGVFSDSVGRRWALIATASSCAVAGLARSFVQSYIAYLALEYLDAVLGAGVYTTGFVLAMEMVGSKKRVLCGGIIASAFALGQVALAVVAWAVPYWRTLTRILYAPSLLFIFYFFFLEESFRWLYSKRKITEAIRVLNKVAIANKKHLSEAAIKRLTEDQPMAKESETQPPSAKSNFYQVIHSRILMWRMAVCSVVWVTSAFIYYGLSINSVSLVGSMYVNYALISLVEIPGYILSVLMLDRLGRKCPIMAAYLVCAVCLIALPFVPIESGGGLSIGGAAQVALAMVGKLCVAGAFNAMYVFTAELFPTAVRHRALAACSLVARTGQITAMLTPLLLDVVPWLPFVLFGALSGGAALLLLLAPETLHAPLPDTVAQAERLSAPVPRPPGPSPGPPHPPPGPPPGPAPAARSGPVVDRYSRTLLADKAISENEK